MTWVHLRQEFSQRIFFLSLSVFSSRNRTFVSRFVSLSLSLMLPAERTEKVAQWGRCKFNFISVKKRGLKAKKKKEIDPKQSNETDRPTSRAAKNLFTRHWLKRPHYSSDDRYGNQERTPSIYSFLHIVTLWYRRKNGELEWWCIEQVEYHYDRGAMTAASRDYNL